MKSLYIKFGICALAIFALFSCKKQNELALSPNKATVEVNVGDTYQLKVNSYGVADTTAYAVSGVTWSSSNEFVAVVNNEGVVTGKHTGLAVICGKLKDGRLVYTDVIVLSKNDLFVEPTLIQSIVAESEAEAGRTLLRSGEGYAVYKDEVNEVAPYVLYWFGTNVSAVVCLDPLTSFDKVSAFLLERYDQAAVDLYKDNRGNTVAVDQNVVVGPALMYNVTTPVASLYSDTYLPAALKDIDKAADANSYTQAALGLKLPFELSADASIVSSLAEGAVTTVSSTTSFTVAESAVDEAVTGIKDLYMNSAVTWAVEEWCWKLHSTPISGGLRKGHDQSQYSQLAWIRVIELDELLQSSLSEATTFSEIDVLAQNYGAIYSDVASLANQASYVKKVNSAYTKASTSFMKTGSELYTSDCWDKVTEVKDAAIDSINNKMWSYSAMATFVKTTETSKNIDTFTGTGSIYADVPTIAITGAVLSDLESNFAQYNEEDYLAANWSRMQIKYAEAYAAIESSVSRAEMTEVSSSAKLYFNDMPKKK